uniref:hypothetical protein n=1 Tax=Nocardia abscessus TaxID=120957 RepID=UPI002458EEB2
MAAERNGSGFRLHRPGAEVPGAVRTAPAAPQAPGIRDEDAGGDLCPHKAGHHGEEPLRRRGAAQIGQA